MYDLVREYDKNRVVDNKEDIDTLLVFVRVHYTASIPVLFLIQLRLV